ncbi:MAG: hypothetical protein ABF649_21480, partial [Bacillus sp. (in: firmicutes)]
YPFFFLSKTLEKDQFKYYRYLNETRTNRNWNQWINFFLESCIKQANDNIKTLNRIDELYQRDKALLMRKHNHFQIENFLEVLYQYPIISANHLSNLSGINYQTARQYINTLVKNRVLFPDQKKRNTKYYHYDIIQNLR